MYNYRTLSKAQLIELVNSIESVLSNAIPAASEAAKGYSDDQRSQLAFEVGHLNGYIKQVLHTIEAYKECSK